jgi:hypothetical protein
MKMKCLFLLLLAVGYAFGQSKDYRVYHTQINKAETLFFCEQSTDSALYYYDKTFSEFDFIFVKDIVNAAQIAKFSKKDYKSYLRLGFKFGLKLQHLNRYLLFKDVYLKLLADKELHKSYLTNREIYLQRINYQYLDWIYKIAIKDQEKKTASRYENNILRSTVEQLRDSILKKGFPGDRLIGIADSSVFKDAGRREPDFKARPVGRKPNWIEFNTDALSETWALYVLVNNSCAYTVLKDVLVKEMIKGNIHPRDIATLYDYSLDCSKLKGAYRLNPFTPEEVYNKISNKLINQMRKELYILPLEVDEIKKTYETKYNFRLFTGFMNSR